jgi:hypothetical protein
MDAIQLNAVLLRNLLPDLRMTPGATFVGRIMERHAGHGLLNLGGTVLVAQLPEGVEAGARLRLAVQEVTPENVVMRIVPDPGGGGAPAQAQGQTQPQPLHGAASAVAIPLPDGTQAQMRLEVVADEEADALRPGGASTKAVTVHYDSPALGRVDVRLVLGPNGLVAGVGAAAGAPVRLAEQHVGELRAGLSRAMGQPVDVHVGRRTEKARVDFRA